MTSYKPIHQHRFIDSLAFKLLLAGFVIIDLFFAGVLLAIFLPKIGWHIPFAPDPDSNRSQVLAAATAADYTSLDFNLPIRFNNTVRFQGFEASDAVVFNADITASGQTVDLSDGILDLTGGQILGVSFIQGITSATGSNISITGTTQNPILNFTGVTSVGGKTGAVTLEAGSGISIDGLKISANVTDASNAQTLDNLDSSSFLRSDTSDSFTSGTLSFSAGTLLDLSTILNDSTTAQGFMVPQAAAFTNPATGEGFIAWDTDDNHLMVYDGTQWRPELETFLTDGGTTTYLTDLNEDLALGGTNSSAPFFFDVSTGNFTATGRVSANSLMLNSIAVTSTATELNLLTGLSGTIWASTNDGTTSGLDADLYDGLNSDQFLRSDAVDSYTNGTLTFTSGTTTQLATGSTIDINGNLSIADPTIVLDAGSTQTIYATGGDLQLGADNDSTNVITISSNTTDLTIGTTDAASLIIDSTGSLTIADATTINNTLTVSDTLTANGQVNLGDSGDSISLTGTSIGITSNGATNDITFTSADDVYFDDLQLTNPITLTDSDTVFASGDTAIVDAINTAYNAAAGGGGGAWTINSGKIYPSAINSLIGIGTTTTGNIISSLYVTHNLASGATGKALAIFNQTESQDLFTASASGITRFTVTNGGGIILNPSSSNSLGIQLNPWGTNNGETLELRFQELAAQGSHYSGFKAPDALASNIIYTLPVSAGSADYVLTYQTGGQLQWKDATGVGGTGDITGIGDIPSGDAFTATIDNDGNQLFFEGTTIDGNEILLTAADSASDTTLTMPGNITATLAGLQPNAVQSLNGTTSLIWLNETNAGSPNLVELEVGGTDTVTINNSGNIATAGDLAVNGGDITSSTNLSITPTGNFALNAAGSANFTFTSGTINSVGAFTINTTGAGNDLFLNPTDDLIFKDAQLSSNLTLTDTDNSFLSADTAIVDAINSAYAAATGSTGGVWTDGGLYLYPSAGESLGNPSSGGGNKLAGIYLADSAPITLGTDNDISMSFAGTVLGVTTGNNDINFDSDTLYIDGSSNNIGIGTTAPNQKVDIAGDIELANTIYFANATTEYLSWDSSNFIITDDFLPSTDATVDLGSTTTRWRDLYVSGSSIHIGTNSNEALIKYDTTNNYLTLDPDGNSTPNFYFNDSGQLGVGMAPTQVLEVAGNTQITSTTPQLIFNETDQVPWQYTVGGDQFILQRNGSDRFVINNAGDVIFKGGTFYNNEDSIVRIGAAAANSDLYLVANNSDRLSIKSSGNVGIGTTNPNSKLEVVPNGGFVNIPYQASVTDGYSLGLGNYSAYLWRNYVAPVADTFTISTNYYRNNAGTNVIPNAGGNTTSIDMGYRSGTPGISFNTGNGIGNAPVTRMFIQDGGNVGIGTTDTSTGRLRIYNSAGLGTNNIYSDMDTSATMSSDQGYYGITTIARSNANQNGFNLYVAGAQNYGYKNTAGTGWVMGSINYAVANHSSGTVSDAYGLYGYAYLNNNGNLTNAYGVVGYAGKNAGTGTVANAYGGYFQSWNATTKWGVYAPGADNGNYFAGSVSVGTTSQNDQIYAYQATNGSALHLQTGSGNWFFGNGGTDDAWIRLSIAQDSTNYGTAGFASQKLFANDLNLNAGVTVYDAGGVLTNTNPSSRDYKHDIEDLDLNSERLLDLRLRSFKWNSDNRQDYGFIAEEIRDIIPEVYSEDTNNNIKGYQPDRLIFYLIELAQIQDRQISSLKENQLTKGEIEAITNAAANNLLNQSWTQFSASISAMLTSQSTNTNDLTLDQPIVFLEDALLGSDLYVAGVTNLNQTNITGTVSVIGQDLTQIDLTNQSLNRIGGPLYLQSTGLHGINFLAGQVTISATGDIHIKGDLTVEGQTQLHNTQILGNLEASGSAVLGDLSVNSLKVATSSAGTAVVPAGQSQVEITYTTPKQTAPIINITPIEHFDTYALFNISQTSFTIKLTAPAAADRRFSYVIIDQ